jgi:hypothetical protein
MSQFFKYCHLVPVLLIALAISASADSPIRSSSFAYDMAHEVTVQAIIQKVVSQRAGAGHESLSLVITHGDSTQEVDLGSFLPKDAQDLLVAKKPVQLIGAMRTFKGKQTFMVRQFILDGHVVAVRNEHGFFLRPNQKPIEFHHVAAASVPAQGKVQQGEKQ